MILKDAHVSPNKQVLQNALSKTYALYEELISTVTASGFDLVPQWQYYRDGKAWLCKVQYKKKTVFWLSVWGNYFKIGFYFTEKDAKGIEGLNIDKNIKREFAESRAIGKLRPLGIEMKKKSQLKEALQIIEYKKSLI